jgi:hypothetical protein
MTIDGEARRLGAALQFARPKMGEVRLLGPLANPGCSCGPGPRCSSGRSLGLGDADAPR